jgi:hypothetical protein
MCPAAAKECSDTARGLQGVSSVGSFFKHTSTKAQAVVGQSMAKMQQSPRHSSHRPSPSHMESATLPAPTSSPTRQPVEQTSSESLPTDFHTDESTSVGAAPPPVRPASPMRPVPSAPEDFPEHPRTMLRSASSVTSSSEIFDALNGTDKGRRVREGDSGVAKAAAVTSSVDGQSERKGVYIRMQV